MTDVSYKDIIDAVQSLETKIDDKFEKIDIRFESLDKRYPSKDSFKVVQVICFSIIGSIGLAFLNSLIEKNMGVTTEHYVPVITPIVQMVGNTATIISR